MVVVDRAQTNVHYDVVEGDVWHTTLDMLDRKYRKSYRMIFFGIWAFSFGVDIFLRPIADMFVRPPVPVKKHVSLVVYQLAQCAPLPTSLGIW